MSGDTVTWPATRCREEQVISVSDNEQDLQLLVRVDSTVSAASPRSARAIGTLTNAFALRLRRAP
jgi:hypothetical protein